MHYRAAMTIVAVLVVAASARPQDWPQWRGPLGQGITTAKNLPPAPGTDSLKVLWKTPVPGEGCSSPIVSQGRVYLTTAYEGSQRHAWDQPAYWAIIVLACAVTGLGLAQCVRNVNVRCASWKTIALGAWTVAAVVLTVVVLAKPMWFWKFADPWIGTRDVAAALPWVESLSLRPAIVIAFGSLVLIFVWLTADSKQRDVSTLKCWLRVVTIAVTVACGAALGVIGWQPDWFIPASQPWLVWLVTGGLGLFALAGSIDWLGQDGKLMRSLKMILIAVSFVLAVSLFCSTPNDEFGWPLSMQNRIIYLVPGVVLLSIHATALFLTRGRKQGDVETNPSKANDRPGVLGYLSACLLIGLSLVLFVRANYLEPQTGIVRAVLCLDATSGEVLWTTPIYVAETEKRHSLNSLATPTPACDDERIYAYFGSGLAALDKNGRLLWLKRDPNFAGFIRYGAGSSVVLADDRIILYRDSEFMGHGDHLDDDIHGHIKRRPTVLAAHDKKTGAELWSITPAFSHDSYMTPLVWTRDDQSEVVIATWKTLAGFAVSDGALRWTHTYPMQQIVPSPAVHGDCLIVAGGNVLPSPIVAVRAPNGAGPAQTLWSNSKAGSNIVSPVCWGGLLFSVSHVGVLTCRDAETGRIHWSNRLSGRCLASLVAGDGKVYAVDQQGTLEVFAADTTGSVLATHSLRENCSGTPALAATMIFVRTSGHLYCIGSGE